MDIYIDEFIQSYVNSILRATGVMPDLSTDDYISLRKQAIWEYYHLKIEKNQSVVPKEELRANTPPKYAVSKVGESNTQNIRPLPDLETIQEVKKEDIQYKDPVSILAALGE